MSATIDGVEVPVVRYEWTGSDSTYSVSFSGPSEPIVFVPDTVPVRRSWWQRLVEWFR